MKDEIAAFVRTLIDAADFELDVRVDQVGDDIQDVRVVRDDGPPRVAGV